MARRKALPPPRPAKQQPRKPQHHHPSPANGQTTRRFLNRGVQVEINEAPGRVALTLDGVPIDVSVDRGEYFSHVAHMFTGFGSMDALVDHLLANEGRTWSLHGHVCDERCRGGGHHHGHGSGHGHGHDHRHDHGHGAPVTPDHPHDHGGADHHHGHEHGHEHTPGGAHAHPHTHTHTHEHTHPTGDAHDASPAGSRPQRATRQPAQRPSRKPPGRGGTR